MLDLFHDIILVVRLMSRLTCEHTGLWGKAGWWQRRAGFGRSRTVLPRLFVRGSRLAWATTYH